jgi:hypothetical protein
MAGETKQEGHSQATTKGSASGVADGNTRVRSWNWGNAYSDGRSWTWGSAWSRGRSQSLALTLGKSKGASVGQSFGRSLGFSLGITKGRTEGEGLNVGVTFQKTPLARHRFLKVPNGKTVVSVSDQFHEVMNMLAALTERTVLMKVKGVAAPFLLEVHEVEDPYLACGQPDRCKEWRDDDREQFLERVYAAPFYFVPQWDEHRGRVARFLGPAAAAGSPPQTGGARGFEVDEENPIA